MENDEVSKAQQKIVDEYISKYIDLQLDQINFRKKLIASSKDTLVRLKKIEKINEAISKLTNKYFSNVDRVLEKNKNVNIRDTDTLIDEFEVFINSQLHKKDAISDIKFLETETNKYITKFNNNFKS